jgi:PAS domain S-box-containing protein
MNSRKSLIESFQPSTDAETALNAFLMLSGDLFCMGWQDGYFSKFNAAWEKVLGWTPSELRSRPWIEWVHPDDTEASLQAQRRWERGEWVEFDHRFRHKDGSYRWLCWKVCRDEAGCIYALAKDITATKQLQKEQQERERRFRAIFDRTFQFIGLLEPDGTLIEANLTALEFTGIKHADIVNRPFWEARWWTISPQTQEQLRRAIARAATGEFVRYEVDVLGVGDTVATIDFSLKPVWDEAGNVVLLIPEGRDVSDRKRAETALRLSEKRFRLAVDNFPYVFAIYNAQRRFQFVNAIGIRNSGLVESALLDRTDDEVFPPEITDIYLPFLQRAVETRTAQTQECTIIQPATGEPFTLIVNYVPLLDENGEIYQILGITHDITERKRTEAALQQAYQQLRLHVDNSPLAVLEWDRELRLQTWSKQAEKIFGWKAEEMVGHTWDEMQFIIYEADLETVDSIKTRLLENRESQNICYNRNYTKDGRVLDCEWYNSVLQDEVGNIVSILSLCHDVTERKQAEAALQQALAQLEQRVSDRTAELQWTNEQLQAEIRDRQHTEEALRQSEARYRAIVEDQTELICQFQLDGTLTFVNNAYCRYFGKHSSELLGRQFHPLIPEEDREFVTQNFSSLSIEKPIVTYEHRVILPSGEVRWQQWTNRMLFDKRGNGIEYQAVGRDITKLKEAEAEIRKALERERELSELRSGFVSLVSHEFRTPLTTIQSSAQMLDRYSQKLSQEKKQNHLIRIQCAVAGMTQLLEDVLTIGKAEAGKLKFVPAPIDLVAFCGNLVETLQVSATPQHQILFSSFGNCAEAQLDEKLLGHILTNLLTNAIKYSPQGRTIRFDLSCTSNSAIFRIQDSGIGIPPKDLERLFESFHRASNVGAIRGTGLGLAIVKKCVDTHRGEIAISSEVGVGTTFTVTLPLRCS